MLLNTSMFALIYSFTFTEIWYNNFYFLYKLDQLLKIKISVKIVELIKIATTIRYNLSFCVLASEVCAVEIILLLHKLSRLVRIKKFIDSYINIYIYLV